MSEEAIGRFAHIVCAAKTDVGLKRGNNEDAFGTFPEAGVFCVADGMGGGDDGEIASAAVVKAIGDAVARCLPADEGGYAGDDVVSLLRDGLSGASDWIYRRAVEKRLNGCGSTFVGVVFDATAPAKATAVHAGDSRLYRIRGKKIVQITRDHSAAELLGEKDERKLNPVFRSMVMNAVGVKPKVDAELTPFDVAAGDRVLLCSDGLSRMVPDKKIASVSSAHAEPEDAVSALIDAALKAGGVDNVTVVLLQVGELPPPAAVLPLPNLQDGGDASTVGSDEATCPTLAPPPTDPVSSEIALAGTDGEKPESERPEPDEGTESPAEAPAAEKTDGARHPPKGLVMLAVVFGTLAVLALVYSLMRGDGPSPAVRSAADAIAPAVKSVRQNRDVPCRATNEEAMVAKPSVPCVSKPPKVVTSPTNVMSAAAPLALTNVVSSAPNRALTNGVPEKARPQKEPVRAERSPGAVAFVKACESKALGEFVNALRRLCPQGRLLSAVEVFSKSGATLAVSGSERSLARAAVDLHWALKAVAAASPNWADGFAAEDASDGIIADWRMIQDSELLDDGTPNDAVFAAAARLLANLPRFSQVRATDKGDNR